MDFLNFTALGFRDAWMLATVFGCAIFLLDDIFIDIVAFFSGKKPHKLTSIEFNKMVNLPEKKIAIIIANWHEYEVLERMVGGNVSRLQYTNYEIVIGVYPNDTLTVEAARRCEKRFRNVRVVVNTLDGPTSKGQMLNLMVKSLDNYNKTPGVKPFDILLMQDSEDLIHPYALKLFNYRAEDYDFIQIPVFSLEVPLNKFTAGIYADEFIESHTKDMLVRDFSDAGVPSAGVGTGITWPTVRKVLEIQGEFLNEKTLTEDYHLGLLCHDLNVKSHFACEYFEVTDEKTGKMREEYIATREYFPQKMKQSIKQKTRWALGISLQGFELRKWKSKHVFQTYFLWRDRKGLVNAPLFTSSLLFTTYYLAARLITGSWPQVENTDYAQAIYGLMWANLGFSIFRILQRIMLVQRIYGWKFAAVVPVRWLISNIINAMSTYRAIYQWLRAKFKGELPKWSKTDHVIPEGFGMEGMTILEEGEAEISAKSVSTGTGAGDAAAEAEMDMDDAELKDAVNK